MATKGTLFKWTNYVHGWQPRYFILKNGILLYHKSEHETSFGCRGAIAVKASTLTLHEFDCCRFDVGVCDYVWYLRSETKAERDKWIRALEKQRVFEEENNVMSITNNNIDNNNSTNNNNIVSDLSDEQQQIQHVQQQFKHEYQDELNNKQSQVQSHHKQQQYHQQVVVQEREQQQQQQHLQHSDNFCDAREDFEDSVVDDHQGNNDLIISDDEPHKPQVDIINNHNTANTTTTNTTTTTTTNSPLPITMVVAKPLPPNNPLWPKIDKITNDQLYYAQMGLGQEGSTDGWQLFAEDGQMRLYTRELEIDGLVCDPLKAVHVVKGISGYEMCHRFFSPNTRFEWEQTLESMKVVEEINKETLIFHQIHKRIWPAAQRDAVFWSHIRKVDEPKPSCLSRDDVNPTTRPSIKLHNIWIVCNNSTDKPEIPLESCVRVRLTVSLVCETYIPLNADPGTVKREDLICKIIYSSTINPGGWAPASILRAVYKREYPKFLENFSNYVIASTKSKPIVFE